MYWQLLMYEFNLLWLRYLSNNPSMLENAYNNSLKVFAAYDESRLVGNIPKPALSDNFTVDDIH